MSTRASKDPAVRIVCVQVHCKNPLVGGAREWLAEVLTDVESDPDDIERWRRIDSRSVFSYDLLARISARNGGLRGRTEANDRRGATHVRPAQRT